MRLPCPSVYKLFTLAVLAGLVFTFSGCGSACKDDVDLSDVHTDLKIIRFDKELRAAQNKGEVKAALLKYPVFMQRFLAGGDPSVSADTLAAEMDKLRTDRYIDTMYHDTERIFGDAKQLQSDLLNAFQHVNYYFPQDKAPEIYFAVSGFSTDIFINEQIAVVGLESFLGSKGHYRIPNTPEYIASRMRPETVVNGMMLALSNRYNRADLLDNSLIAQMVHWGKAYYFMKKMQPCVPDSLIIGYTAAQMKSCESQLPKIYGYFVDKSLFYETNHIEVNRYIGERPYTLEISDKCPGRIGRYLGWKIVQQYMEEQKLSIPELMQERDAKKIFAQSKFKP
ncbi:MAG: hypothetical protein V4543_02770 [Bacteroidota bacterium]